MGLFYLRLKVYYQDYQVETETNRDFIIEITGSCLDTVLSIDDTVIRTEPAVSLTQYIGYSTVSL